MPVVTPNLPLRLLGQRDVYNCLLLCRLFYAAARKVLHLHITLCGSSHVSRKTNLDLFGKCNLVNLAVQELALFHLNAFDLELVSKCLRKYSKISTLYFYDVNMQDLRHIISIDQMLALLALGQVLANISCKNLVFQSSSFSIGMLPIMQQRLHLAILDDVFMDGWNSIDGLRVYGITSIESCEISHLIETHLFASSRFTKLRDLTLCLSKGLNKPFLYASLPTFSDSIESLCLNAQIKISASPKYLGELHSRFTSIIACTTLHLKKLTLHGIPISAQDVYNFPQGIETVVLESTYVIAELVHALLNHLARLGYLKFIDCETIADTIEENEQMLDHFRELARNRGVTCESSRCTYGIAWYRRFEKQANRCLLLRLNAVQ